MSKKLFLTSTDAVLDSTGTTVATDWTALSDTEKAALFTAHGSTATSFTGLTGKLRVLAYSTMSTASHTTTITAVPKPQLVKPSGLISLSKYDALNAVTITSTVTNASLKIAVTTDGTTYKAWNGTEWIAVDATDATTFAVNAMDVSVVSTITAAQWASLSASKIGFAYLMTTTASTNVCVTDTMSITVNMKGTWSQGTYGTDYSYTLSDTGTLSVKLLTDGSYKVNYIGE